jgi:hypothetical protein
MNEVLAEDCQESMLAFNFFKIRPLNQKLTYSAPYQLFQIFLSVFGAAYRILAQHIISPPSLTSVMRILAELTKVSNSLNYLIDQKKEYVFNLYLCKSQPKKIFFGHLGQSLAMAGRVWPLWVHTFFFTTKNCLEYFNDFPLDCAYLVSEIEITEKNFKFSTETVLVVFFLLSNL